jgi:hypothetical protein
MKAVWLCFTVAVMAVQAASVPQNAVWPRPVVVPVPASITGVKAPVVSLDGLWKVTVTPPTEFWSPSVDPSSWQDIRLPSHAVTQGVVLPRGAGGVYAFKRKVTIPAEFAGKRILLQFDGVSGEGKAWVNGVHLRDHFGAFTTWDCDITAHVTPGKDAWIAVAATNANEGLSGYNSGGILRSTRLIAVPQDYLTRLNLETGLDAQYRDGVLKVWAGAAFHGGNAATVRLSLKDPQGRAVALKPSSIELTRERPETIVEIPIAAPVKWDAEHPNLYTLEAALSTGETLSRKVGFRKVERVGRKLLVNGKEVKLRGINRKDIYPLTGRSVPVDVMDEDMRIFRAGNINYIRTSHYPTNVEFLDFADRYGMYIESENSISMARGPASANPELTKHYLSQLAEMIERDRSHPAVIMWSLGNESNWGNSVLKSAEYARAEDPSRPLKYSWSHLVPPELQAKVYDLYSFHYPSYRRGMADGGPGPGGDLERNREWGGESTTFPVIHDEYAHVPAYMQEEMRRDPNVDNFWGHSIKMLWEKIFTTEGALGGAIWGSVDNSSIAPEDRLVVSRNNWGLIDGWRRPKPEYWLTQKAYSPVRIEDAPVPNPGAGKPLTLPIRNWFDHTNLTELKVAWSVGRESGSATSPNVAPHAQGTLRLPARAWKDGDIVNLKFYRMGGILVDEYNIAVNPPPPAPLPGPQGPAPAIAEQAGAIVVKGVGFEIVFDRKTGLISSGSYKGTRVIESGPHLNLVGAAAGAWSLKSMRAVAEAAEAVVRVSGAYGATDADFEIRIDGQGAIATKYMLGTLPALTRRTYDEGYRRDVGGFWELGLSYVLTDDVDRLQWRRKGLWSAYPEDHIGRNAGTAHRSARGAGQQYAVKPAWPWSEDEKDYILFGRNDAGGRGARDFRSLKENIYRASALLRGTAVRLDALSDGSAAVRLEVVQGDRRGVRFIVNNEWNYPNLAWGNWVRDAVLTKPGYTNQVRLRLADRD